MSTFARFRGPGAPIESEDPLIELLLSDITTGIVDSGVRAGHTAQLLVSRDHSVHIDYLTAEQRERTYPGWSYVHLFERVLPQLLKEPGIDEEIVRTLLVDNPRRLLSRIAVPRPTDTRPEVRDAA
ncbi:hypothetical protein ACFRAO_32560 [Streptomyces sp. NPDC056656]|uniref:phosphotriesterase family protein n=1 Tax=Streptomyces sp. NPDC056656 TaxID=3345895 RepID=UPI0036C09C3E